MKADDDYAVALLEDQFEDATTMSRSPHLAEWRRPHVQAFAAERAASFRAAADLLTGRDEQPTVDLEEAIGYLAEELLVGRENATQLLDPADAENEWARVRQVEQSITRLRAARQAPHTCRA